MLRISEVFYSIQGEGVRVGAPSVFVRVGLCNLSCKGFGGRIWHQGEEIIGCDSIYAASSKFREEWLEIGSSEELIGLIESKGRGKFDIVLTGGEPSLYFGNRALLEGLEHFLQRGHRVSVESNGSLQFDFDEILRKLDFTLSVKLSNSLEPKNRRINIPAIQNILDNAKSVVFKFVLNAQMCEGGVAMEEISEILHQVRGEYEVFLMPQGSDVGTLERNIEAILPLCLAHGYRLADRLHIRIWGDKRGV